MKIHYLFDVDDTLLTNIDGKLVFNETAINWLKERGVTHISFLTKMDAKHLSITSPIRIKLIEHLENHGITVDKIYTPLDMLFRVGQPDFPLGGVYDIHMKAVENAIVPVREIPRHDFEKYNNYNSMHLTINAMKFLVTNGIIDGETQLADLNDEEKQTAILHAVDSYFLQHYPESAVSNKNNIDYYVIEEVFNHIKYEGKKTPNMLFNELIVSREKTAATYQAQLPQLPHEQMEVLTNFFNELTHYRNTNYNAQLLMMTKGADMNHQFTKGEVYTALSQELHFTEDDVVIFADDSSREHTSVREAHKTNHFNHQLITTLPPFAKGFDQYSIAKEAFKNELLPSHIRQLNSTEGLPREHISYLNSMGITLAQQGQHQVAAHYFKAVFMVCPKGEEFDRFRTAAINNYQFNYAQISKETPDTADKENLFITSLLSDMHHASHFAMRIKSIEFDIALHQSNHPGYYAQRQSRFHIREAFFSKLTDLPVDREFQSKIIDKLQLLAEQRPAETLEFVKALKEIVLPKAFKDSLQNLIDTIANKMNTQNLPQEENGENSQTVYN